MAFTKAVAGGWNRSGWGANYDGYEMGGLDGSSWAGTESHPPRRRGAGGGGGGQRGRLWTACGQRCVDSKNSQTTPPTTSTTPNTPTIGRR